MGNCLADCGHGELEENDEPEPGAEVILQIYDVTGNEKVVKANNILYRLGTGAFHAGVEVYGTEWGYGKSRFCGIFPCSPRQCAPHSYRESVQMGRTTLSRKQVEVLLQEMAPAWPGTSYDLLSCNCTHFANAFCQRLGVGPVPKWVTNLGAAGAALRKGAAVVNKVVKAPYRQLKSTASNVNAGAKYIVHAGKWQRGVNPYMASYHIGDVTRGLVAVGKEMKGKEADAPGGMRDWARGARAAALGRLPRPAPASPYQSPAALHDAKQPSEHPGYYYYYYGHPGLAGI